MYLDGSSQADRAVAGTVLNAWLPIELDKEKRIEQTKVHMHESTDLIWHIQCVKRHLSTALVLCVAPLNFIL